MACLHRMLVYILPIAQFIIVDGCGEADVDFGGIETVAKLLKAASSSATLSQVTAIQLTLPQGVTAQASIGVGLEGTRGVVHAGSEYAGSMTATGCPALVSTACCASSSCTASNRGWSFSAASLAADGTLTIPMNYTAPQAIKTSSARAGSHFSSWLLLLVGAAGALATLPLPRATTFLVIAIMVGYLSLGGETTAASTMNVGGLHIRLFDVANGTVADSNTLKFTCPPGGCSSSTTCSTSSTTFTNVCLCGWVDGRPFTTPNGAVLAKIVHSRDSCWSHNISSSSQRNSDISTRAIEAERWRSAALAEHASVAAFSRASLELMALGAPSSLLEAVHSAALDEIRHARGAFSLARFFGADGAAPSALPLPPLVEVSSSLGDVARRTLQEGCISETEAVVRAQMDLMTDVQADVVREHLQVVIAEEAKHAALAWRTVAWAMTRRDSRVFEMLDSEKKHLQSELERIDASQGSELKKTTMLKLTLPWIDKLLQIGDSPTRRSWPPMVSTTSEEAHSNVDAAVHATEKLIAAELLEKSLGEAVI